jgi:23S rRNA (guanosine2251-2'-O)-methyltransferase
MPADTLWVWGRHPVLEAIRAGTAHAVLLASGRKPSPVLTEIRAAARVQGIPVREVDPAEINRIAPGQNTQGVAAQIVRRRLTDMRDLLSSLPASSTPLFLLALDQIQDPQNFGALLRTADAAGVQGVIVPEHRSAPVSGAVAKSSAGAVSYIPIVEVTNLARTVDELRASGVWVVGLDGSARQSIYSVDLTEPLALVVGSEGAGLRRLTREHCDVLASLPMIGRVASLNAAIAGSIAMYEVVRQRAIQG